MTIQINEPFVHLRSGTRDQEQKLIRPENAQIPKGSKRTSKHPKIQKVIFAKRQGTESKSSLNAKIQKVIFAKRPGTKSKS